MLSKCNFHLVYLGRGINAELMAHTEPLAELGDQETVISLVVRTLMTTENAVIKKLDLD